MNKKQLLEYAWIIVLLSFTAWQTAAWVMLATPASGWALYVRMAVAVFVTDVSILYWQFQTRALKSDRQRRWAGFMLTCAVVLTGLLGLAYVAFTVFSWQAWKVYVEAAAMGLLAIWVMLSVGVQMIVSWLDPDTRLTVHKASTDGATLTERNNAYREAMNVLRPLFAKTMSLKAVRSYAEDNGHTPAEVQAIVAEAGAALDRHYGNVPARAQNVPARRANDGTNVPAITEADLAPFLERLPTKPSNGNGQVATR